MDPDSISHAMRAGANQVVCVRRIKTAMLAQTAVCRGVVPLISNLFHSDDPVTSSTDGSYHDGLGYEMYDVRVSKVLYYCHSIRLVPRGVTTARRRSMVALKF